MSLSPSQCGGYGIPGPQGPQGPPGVAALSTGGVLTVPYAPLPVGSVAVDVASTAGLTGVSVTAGKMTVLDAGLWMFGNTLVFTSASEVTYTLGVQVWLSWTENGQTVVSQICEGSGSMGSGLTVRVALNLVAQLAMDTPVSLIVATTGRDDDDLLHISGALTASLLMPSP